MRRENPRVSLDILVNKVVDGVPYLASTRDISLGGIYLNEVSEPEHRADARIAIELMLPGQHGVIWLETDVVRHEHRRGAGLAFRDVSPRTQQHLRSFLEDQVCSSAPSPG